MGDWVQICLEELHQGYQIVVQIISTYLLQNLQLKKGLVYYGTHFEVHILLELLNQDSRVKSPSCCTCENYVK